MTKIISLKRTFDFKRVYNAHRSKANKYLVMYVLENDLGYNRLGISVSKRVGNSVVRHRLTRLIRESYRLRGDIFNSGLDIVVVARMGAGLKSVGDDRLKCADIQSAMLHLAGLLGILNRADKNEEDNNQLN